MGPSPIDQPNDPRIERDIKQTRSPGDNAGDETGCRSRFGPDASSHDGSPLAITMASPSGCNSAPVASWVYVARHFGHRQWADGATAATPRTATPQPRQPATEVMARFRRAAARTILGGGKKNGQRSYKSRPVSLVDECAPSG